MVINYLRQGGYVFARLCLFVCLFVCLCVSKTTQKFLWTDLSEIFWECRKWQNYQRFNFGGDPEGILNSGSL